MRGVEEAATLPSLDALQQLLACAEAEGVKAEPADADGGKLVEPQQPPPPSSPQQADDSARPASAGRATRVGVSEGSVGLREALEAAQEQLRQQQADIARLTQQLQQPSPTPAATPPPSSSSSPLTPSSSQCTACAESQSRMADLSAALSSSQLSLSSLTTQLTSCQVRIAELEASLTHSSSSHTSATHQAEVIIHDLTRLLDDATKRHQRDMADARREGEEAVAMLERQQEKERGVWAAQVEAMQAAADADASHRDTLTTQVSSLQTELSTTRTQLSDTSAALLSLRDEAASALSARDTLRTEVASLTSHTASLTTQLTAAVTSASSAHSLYLEEQRRRKHFQFQYEDAKGKVRVYARVRPFTAAEVAARERTLLRVGRNQWTIDLNETQRDVLGTVSDKWREFAFDHVFHAGLGGMQGNGSQAEVFAETELFAELSLQGINTCVFAYGQSGTGKTWTMSGVAPSEANGWSTELRGLKPRMIDKVFALTAESATTHTFTVSCYMLEIYLNALEDLFWKLDTATHLRATSKGTVGGGEGGGGGGLGCQVAGCAGAEGEGGRCQEEGGHRQRAHEDVHRRGRHAGVLR